MIRVIDGIGTRAICDAPGCFNNILLGEGMLFPDDWIVVAETARGRERKEGDKHFCCRSCEASHHDGGYRHGPRGAAIAQFLPHEHGRRGQRRRAFE